MGTATLPNYQTKDFPQLSKKKNKNKTKTQALDVGVLHLQVEPGVSRNMHLELRAPAGAAGRCKVTGQSPVARLAWGRAHAPRYSPLKCLCPMAQPPRALLVLSPADGNVDGFDFLAIVTSAAASPLVGMNFSSVASGTRLARTYIKLMFNIFRSCFRGG